MAIGRSEPLADHQAVKRFGQRIVGEVEERVLIPGKFGLNGFEWRHRSFLKNSTASQVNRATVPTIDAIAIVH